MVSFRGQKKVGPRPDRSPLGVLIQNFRRASPPLSYAESTPGMCCEGDEMVQVTRLCQNNTSQDMSQYLPLAAFECSLKKTKYTLYLFSIEIKLVH